MVPISFTDISDEHKEQLKEVASQSILHGLEHGKPLPVTIADYPAPLQVEAATFVTLHKLGALRGCIGMLEAVQPMVRDVANNAFSAAFSDPRFPAVERDEFAQLDISLSLLSSAMEMVFSSETEVLEKLSPHVDGVILQDGGRRSTFLPSVWEQLPEPAEFLAQLKVKAGLPRDHWSGTMSIQTYTVLEIK